MGAELWPHSSLNLVVDGEGLSAALADLFIPGGKKRPRSLSGRLNGSHSQSGLTLFCLCRESNNDISDVQPTA